MVHYSNSMYETSIVAVIKTNKIREESAFLQKIPAILGHVSRILTHFLEKGTGPQRVTDAGR